MNINLLTIAFEWLFFFGNFIMAFSKDAPPADKNYTNQQCAKIILFDVSYWMHWVAHIASTAVTCYMNVQFSKDIGESNRQFMMVFNESVAGVRETYASNQIEEENR